MVTQFVMQYVYAFCIVFLLNWSNVLSCQMSIVWRQYVSPYFDILKFVLQLTRNLGSKKQADLGIAVPTTH